MLPTPSSQYHGRCHCTDSRGSLPSHRSRRLAKSSDEPVVDYVADQEYPSHHIANCNLPHDDIPKIIRDLAMKNPLSIEESLPGELWNAWFKHAILAQMQVTTSERTKAVPRMIAATASGRIISKDHGICLSYFL